jgi:hypothetical protein
MQNKQLLVGLALLGSLGACAESGREQIFVTQVAPHFIVTRQGLSIPSGRIVIDTDSADELAGVYDNGAATIEFTARVQRDKGLLGTAELVFPGDRRVRLDVDFASGQVKLAGNDMLLTTEDLFDMARLQLALHGANARVGDPRFQMGQPRHMVDGLLNIAGMVPAGGHLGNLEREFSSLALYQGPGRALRTPVVEDHPPAGEVATPVAPSPSADPFYWVPPEDGSCSTPPPPSVYLKVPNYTGAKIGTGGTGVKCVSEGYYYAVG